MITDSFENQRDNKVDALFEIVDGRAVRLSNVGNRDLWRLYQWTLFTPDSPSSGVSKARCEREIAGKRYQCICTSGQTGWKKEVVLYEESVCPEFLWTHGPGRFADASSGEDVLAVEVVEAGRREGAVAQPLEP